MNNPTLGLFNDVLLKNEVLILLYVHFCVNAIHVGHVQEDFEGRVGVGSERDGMAPPSEF